MAKQVKSVRFDEELLELFSEYSALLNEMFGYTLSFSAIANEAFAEFIKESTDHWYDIMQSQSVVKSLPNGKVKKYEFTETQITKMNELRNEALALWASAQQQ